MTAPIQTTYNQAIINPDLRQEQNPMNWNGRIIRPNATRNLNYIFYFSIICQFIAAPISIYHIYKKNLPTAYSWMVVGLVFLEISNLAKMFIEILEKKLKMKTE